MGLYGALGSVWGGRRRDGSESSGAGSMVGVGGLVDEKIVVLVVMALLLSFGVM